MAITNSIQSLLSFKKEGTSQTYGQFITFPSKKDSLPLTSNVLNQSSKDILVKLVSNGGGKITPTSIIDTERSKIALAAFSTNKQAVINLPSSVSLFGEFSKVESPNISNLYRNNEDFAIVVGGLKPIAELKTILAESAKVDLFVTLKSQESEVVEYNTLKEVKLESKFVYNFHTPEETNIASQEDQSKDPLLKNDIFNVPRYVKINWDPKHVTERLNHVDEIQKAIVFDNKPSGILGYGSYNFKDSFLNSAKKTNLFSFDGKGYELADVHNLDVVFNSTNNSRVFANTLNVVLNTARNSSPITTLPINLGSSTATSVGFLPVTNSLIRATVPNASFSSLYMTSSAPSLDPSSKLSLSVLGEAVSDILIKRAVPVGFDSIKEFVGLEYVGYILIKERLNRNTGEWHRIDEYKIIGAEASSFIDTRVAYGEIYRYRMKTVARLTQKETITEVIDNSGFQNVQTLILQKIQEQLALKFPLFQNSFQFFNLGLSNFNNQVNISMKEVKLFDNYYASFEADRIDVFQKTPGVQTQNLRTEKNSKITSLSYLNNKFNVYLPLPDQKIPTQKIAYKSYYYESLPSIEWKYVDIYEDTLPPAPQSIKISPNTLSNQIMISWLRPSDSARDIAAYRVYRRNKFGEKWDLLSEIKELDVDDDGTPDIPLSNSNSANLYIDKDVNIKNQYIYALSCVDIHGIESFLSAQIQAELNPNFIFEKEEKALKWISGGGATPQELDFVYKKFLSRTETIIAKSKIKITVNTKFKDTTKNFILKVTSLDTHEKREYKLTINNVSKARVSYAPKGTAGK